MAPFNPEAGQSPPPGPSGPPPGPPLAAAPPPAEFPSGVAPAPPAEFPSGVAPAPPAEFPSGVAPAPAPPPPPPPAPPTPDYPMGDPATDTISRIAAATGVVAVDDTPAPGLQMAEAAAAATAIDASDEADPEELLAAGVWDDDWDWDVWEPLDEVEALPELGRLVRFSSKEDGQMSEKNDAMRVAPREVEQGMVWGVEIDDLTAMALWLERRPGHGEDAQPTFLFDIATGTGLVATYDGTGGSGSAPVRSMADGKQLSGAYVASRVARKGTESWFAWALDNPEDDRGPEEQLQQELKRRLDVELSQGLKASGKFAGSLRRDLPTTMAGSAFIATPGKLTVASLWAGDSRCYVLSPDLGMQQLTSDDTPTRDALEAIVTDAPMSNLVCADRPFHINREIVELRVPAIILSATDGCFGYVATPAHFEHLILKHLMNAPDVHTWAEGVLNELAGFTSDDASLALVAVGWSTYLEVQTAFTTRAKVLRANHWEPFIDLDMTDREKFTSARMASWRRYKQLYEEYLPRAPEHASVESENLAPPVAPPPIGEDLP